MKPRKIAIVTNLMDVNPGYSLSGIISDQALMLKRYGHQVEVFVNEIFNDRDKDAFGDVPIRKVVPFTHLKDYASMKEISKDHMQIVAQTAQNLARNLEDFNIAFTHDLIFTGWFLPYALGIQAATKALPRMRWMHWIHSIPSRASDWWNITEYGKNHKIIYPNTCDTIKVAEQYRANLDWVRVIPHIKDPRTWWDFGEDTCAFIDQYPGVMQADIVQILPASADRLFAKRVAEVMMIFKHIKKMGKSICLVIANQWATERVHGEEIGKYREKATNMGLSKDEVIFTSEFKEPTYKAGIPRKMLRELFLLSNVFIFPTRDETFGLVVPEAALSGTLMLLNRSLENQREITGSNSIYFSFGSFNQNWQPANMDGYCYDLALILLGRILQNETIKTKTFCRQRYNMDSLYHNYYEPVMAESSQWPKE